MGKDLVMPRLVPFQKVIMKSIETLVSDINSRLCSDEPYPPEAVETFGKNLIKTLVEKLNRGDHKPALRMSNLGWPDRKLWYSVNKPELAEKLPASARLKFLFGDIIEAVLLFLAGAAGHKVEHQQGEVSVAGVRGHIDAVIDGELVDAKSASPASYRKFVKKELVGNDPFGYLSQLGGYLSSLPSLDADASKSRAHFLVAEKVLGKIVLDTHQKEDLGSVTAETVAQKRAMLAWPQPPSRCYSDVVEDNGNRTLSVGCSYCPFKSHCWTGLRAFKYSKGPVFFTKVVKTPAYKGEPLRELTLAQAVEE